MKRPSWGFCPDCASEPDLLQDMSHVRSRFFIYICQNCDLACVPGLEPWQKFEDLKQFVEEMEDLHAPGEGSP